MGTTHSTSGATVWLAGCAAAHALNIGPSLWHVAAGAVVCAGAALVPDIDHHSSRITRAAGVLTLGLSWVMGWLSARVYAATKTSRDRSNRNGHRALTHTGLFAVAAGLLIAVAFLAAGLWWAPLAGGWWLGIPVAVGCLAHDLGDACTRSGCPILWPAVIGGQRWYPVGLPRLLRIRTNTWPEHLLYMPALIVGALFAGYATIA